MPFNFFLFTGYHSLRQLGWVEEGGINWDGLERGGCDGINWDGLERGGCDGINWDGLERGGCDGIN